MTTTFKRKSRKGGAKHGLRRVTNDPESPDRSTAPAAEPATDATTPTMDAPTVPTPEVAQVVDLEPTADKLRLRAIRDSEAEVEIAESKYLAAKEEAKACKAVFEGAVAQLRVVIKSRNLQPILPFAAQVETVTTNEEWRAVSIGELGLGTRATNALTEAKLTTIGALADWTTDGNDLTDVKGVGDGAREEIEAALERFWREHPIGMKAAQPAAKPAETDEARRDREAGLSKLDGAAAAGDDEDGDDEDAD